MTKTKLNPGNSKPKFEFTIDRSKWITGTLNDGDGRMCAMGFLAEAIGIPKEEIRGGMLPLDDPKYKSRWGELGFLTCDGTQAYSNNLAEHVASINDSTRRDEREKKLKQLFSGVGIKVNFVDKK